MAQISKTVIHNNPIFEEFNTQTLPHIKKMQKHESGAIRENKENKPKFELISPIVLEKLAIHFSLGAKEHGDRNWEKGLPLSNFIASAGRHLNAIKLGKTDEDHESALLWNIHGYIHTNDMIKRGKLPKELSDMPNYF